jgi:hypothetical protein
MQHDHARRYFLSSDYMCTMSMPPNQPSTGSMPAPLAAVKIIRVAVVVALVLGASYYVWMKPPTLKPLTDPRAAAALALVQTHRAQGYPSILEAMTEHVRSMSERNRVARLGEWRVKQVEGDLYEIRVHLRDQGVTGQWFEREFIWHADLALKKVNAASLAADGVTPKAPDAVP